MEPHDQVETDARDRDGTDLFDKVVNLCKRRGFVFPSAEIYGGFRSAYDYGPLGVLMLRNVKDAWWRSMVQLRDDVVGLDAVDPRRRPRSGRRRGTSRTSPTRWSTAANCQERFREDQLDDPDACPNCGGAGTFTEARQFNLMFKTYAGPVEDERRGGLPPARDGPGHVRQLHERADDAPRKKPPFGIAQIGKSLPQRDHAGQLHVPDPRVRADGDGVLRPAGRRPRVARVLAATSGCNWYVDLGIPERQAAAAAPTTPTSCRTTRRAPPTSSSSSRGDGASSRGSPTAPTTTCVSTPSTRASGSSTSTRHGRAVRPSRDRAGRRRDPAP